MVPDNFELIFNAKNFSEVGFDDFVINTLNSDGTLNARNFHSRGFSAGVPAQQTPI